MSDTQTTEHERPFIHIEAIGTNDLRTANIRIRAGGGIESAEEIVALLLAVTEQLTGVSPALYAQEIEIAQRAAGGGPLFDLDHDDD